MADAGYYHQGGSTIYRYWNGNSFTSSGSCPTPTPTSTSTSTPTPTMTVTPSSTWYQWSYNSLSSTSSTDECNKTCSEINETIYTLVPSISIGTRLYTSQSLSSYLNGKDEWFVTSTSPCDEYTKTSLLVDNDGYVTDTYSCPVTYYYDCGYGCSGHSTPPPSGCYICSQSTVYNIYVENNSYDLSVSNVYVNSVLVDGGTWPVDVAGNTTATTTYSGNATISVFISSGMGSNQQISVKDGFGVTQTQDYTDTGYYEFTNVVINSITSVDITLSTAYL